MSPPTQPWSLLLGLPPAYHPATDIATVVESAVRAKAVGFAGVVVTGYVVMGARTDRYPWGALPSPFDGPWLEPLTLLAFLGAATRGLRLCTGVLTAALRPAVLLAKTAATLDRLSGGRLEVGVGVGWQREEFEAANLDFAGRGWLLTDTVAACRELWGPSPSRFSSPTVSFDRIWCEPKPVGERGQRVLFGGAVGGRNLERIVTLGDGWITPVDQAPGDLARDVSTVRSTWEAAGRDGADLVVRAAVPLGPGGLDASLNRVSDLWASGVTDAVVPLRDFVRTVSDQDGFFVTTGGWLASAS